MDNFKDMGEPVRVVRDAGYSKIKCLSPEFKKKSLERIKDPNYKSNLKKLYAKMGIIVNPDKMTNWYVYDDEE